MDNRGGRGRGREGGREHQDFPSKFLCLTVPKFSVGESFSVLLIWVSKKIRQEGEWEFQDFPSKFFCLSVPKNSVGESFSVSFFSGIEKNWTRGGGGVSRFSVEIFLSLSAKKIPLGNLLVFHYFRASKTFMDEEGDGKYHNFSSKLFWLTVPKIFVGAPFSVS